MANYPNKIMENYSSQKGQSIFWHKVSELIGAQFRNNDPPLIMRAIFNLTEDKDLERICGKVIWKAADARNEKLSVKRKGVITDENGHRVEAFAFAAGQYAVEQTLYRGIVVIMRSGRGHLLLIRSDVTTAFNKLFPDIGTERDWRGLLKCVDRFSPKWSSHRYEIDIRESRNDAVRDSAAIYLEQSGVFQPYDMEVLLNMAPAKLHMLDLCSIIVLTPVFTQDIAPRMINIICTRNSDDSEEIQRILRAWTFSPGEQTSGLYVPHITVTGKRSLEEWQKSTRFAYMMYNKAKDIDCLFEAMSRAQASSAMPFSTVFPYPPVVVGPNIWSNQLCVEIDMRGLRFSDEELLVGRKYIASLLKNHERLMAVFAETWRQDITTPNAAITPYPQLWYQAFHFAAGTALFPVSSALMDYLGLTREADARRLRLRTDRTQRYDDAIKELNSATNDAPWLYLSKPATKEEALELLKMEYDAFLHQKDGKPVLAFTKVSLIRFAKLESGELDDFVSKLKENHLLEHKTHPITFANKEQFRFICIKAKALTVTAGSQEGEDA